MVTTILSTSVENQLKTYVQEVTAKFALPIDFNPENQLKTPTDTFFNSIGAALDLEVKVVTEAQTGQLGRPDMGIAVKGLLAGHVELKAPTKGADPDELKGDDKRQWERFKNLPYLIYTDGNASGGILFDNCYHSAAVPRFINPKR